MFYTPLGPRMSELRNGLARASNAIGDLFEAVYDDLTTMALSCERELQVARGRKAELTERHLRAIQPAAATFLKRHAFPSAAGIVLGPDFVDNNLGAVEWWIRGDSGAPKRLVLNLSPDDPGFYDFVTYEWFAEVVSTGKPAMQGPYLDYAGMDKYIVTAMVPLSFGGEIIGTAGCDTEIRDLETIVMPILRTIPADAALISKFDRIVVGNSGRFLVGNRIVALPQDAIRMHIPGPDLGLQLVATPQAINY